MSQKNMEVQKQMRCRCCASRLSRSDPGLCLSYLAHSLFVHNLSQNGDNIKSKSIYQMLSKEGVYVGWA